MTAHSVPIAIAAMPIAMYFILLGWFRLSRHPLVTTGWRDTAALGIALMGLFAIGPVHLFFPTYAAARFSVWVWVMLLLLYLLSLVLVVLSCRPRLIVYGVNEETFIRTLLNAALQVDPSAHWHGQVLNLPALQMQLANDPTGSPAIQQVVSIGGLYAVTPWLELERALVKECKCKTVASTQTSWTGLMLMLSGCAIIAFVALLVLQEPAQAQAQLREFFIR